MATMQVEGTDVFTTDTGGSGEPVVFLHGFLFDGRSYDAQVAGLRDDYRCITMDWPGQGRSARPSGGYSTERLTTYAERFLEQLDAGPVHLVGLSMGGFAGIRVAARRPDLLRSLSLLNTSAGPHARSKFPKLLGLAAVARVAGLRMGPLVSAAEGEMYGEPFLHDPAGEAVCTEWRKRWADADRHALVQTLLGFMGRADFRPQLSAITMPTLIIAGGLDVSLPVAQSREIHDRIPGSRLVELPDVGHSSVLEAPDAVAAIMREFLDSVPAAGPTA